MRIKQPTTATEKYIYSIAHLPNGGIRILNTQNVVMPKEDPPFYCGEILHNAKREKIISVLKRRDLDAFLFLKAEAVRYVSDFYAKGYRPFMDPEYFCLFTKGGDLVIGYSSGSDEHRLKSRLLFGSSMKIGSGTKGWIEAIRNAIIDFKLADAKIAVDLLPYEFYEGLKNELPGVKFTSAEDAWTELTAVKHPVEIELLRESAKITDIGLQTALESIRPGVKENEVAAKAEYAMRSNGSEMTPFITNIASGRNAAIFERLATEKVIHDSELVLVDIGSVYRGYTGDAGRTTIVGTPTKKQKEIYQVTYAALQEAIGKVKPGAKCSEIDAAARLTMRESGYEKYASKFATGHQLGYGLHSHPLINQGVEDRLKPNMVIALELRINMFDTPEIGGTHLEDMVLVTEAGHEVLTKTPFDDKLLK